MSPDYTALLRRLRDPLQLRAIERIIQFPFVLSVADKCTEEEIARAAEKRREQVKSCKKWQLRHPGKGTVAEFAFTFQPFVNMLTF
jgi:hypothetical protein